MLETVVSIRKGVFIEAADIARLTLLPLHCSVNHIATFDTYSRPGTQTDPGTSLYIQPEWQRSSKIAARGFGEHNGLATVKAESRLCAQRLIAKQGIIGNYCKLGIGGMSTC